jgi:hydrogenase maturation protease
VDTVVTGAPAGKVWLWDAGQVRIQGSLSLSTHGLGVAEAIRLARVLDRLPKRLRVFGIEGQRFDVGVDISPEVLRAVEEVAKQITAEGEGIVHHPIRPVHDATQFSHCGRQPFRPRPEQS